MRFDWLRDPVVSPRVLAEIGVEAGRIHVTGDDAVPSAGGQAPCPDAGPIGFNLRQAPYSDITMDLADAIAGVVGRAAIGLGQAIQVLPANLEAPSDTAATCMPLRRTGFASPNPFISTLDALLGAITRCRIVVTASYHIAVFALAKGRPVVALARSGHYRQKLGGLVKMFGPSCRLIELDDAFEATLRDSILSFWAEADTHAAQLHRAAKRQLALQEAFWNRLPQLVNTRDK
jgi:hypothetical protein